MFSIIVCSLHPNLLQQLKGNLAETIGAPYELLVWDNGKAQRGLCEVYNELAAKASFPYCLFLHEDILFQTMNWGQIAKTAFENNHQLGLLGIAGPTYKSRTPSGWSTGLPAIDRANIFHRDPEGNTIHIYQNPDNLAIEPVVSVDGVFLCCSKATWQANPFNQQLLKGFHGYDLDFSISIGRRHRVAVSFEIDIMHLTTGGNFGDQWLLDTLAWHRLHRHELPVWVGPNPQNGNPEAEIRKKCLHRLRNEKISIGNKFRWILHSGALTAPGSWLYVLIFLFPAAYETFRRNT